MKLGTPLLLIALISFTFNIILADPKLFTVGKSRVIEINIPDRWTSTLQDAEAEGGIAIRIEPPGKLPLILFLSPLVAEGSCKMTLKRSVLR